MGFRDEGILFKGLLASPGSDWALPGLGPLDAVLAPSACLANLPVEIEPDAGAAYVLRRSSHHRVKGACEGDVD